MPRDAGFTLIEILVALVVLSVALLALLQLHHVQLQQTARLNDRILARWIADDVLIQAQLGQLAASQGQACQWQQYFHWRLHRDTSQGLSRLTVAVFPDHTSQALIRLQVAVP